MIKSYFKIAWRNITKRGFYSLLSIAGLATGLVFTFLISAYVWKELQVNKELRNVNNQYIIQSKWKEAGQGYELATLGPLAKSLKENYPNLVVNYYRYDGVTSNVTKGDKAFREGLQIGDSTLLNMYGFSLLYGNKQTALTDPFTAIITTDKAIKYFGKKDVIGETITIENFSGSRHDFKITGVLNKISKNSITTLVDDFPNEIYVSATNLDFFGRNMNWNNSSIASFIELKEGVKAKDLEQPIKQIVSQNVPTQISANLTPYITPLNKYYLVANNGLVKKMLYALSGIALFILLMAIVNFVNMAVSNSSTRMKEIGIRKVMGGLKKQLIIQFLTESVIFVLLSTLLAIIIFIFSRNTFSNLLGKPIPSLTEFPLYFIAFPLLIILVVGIIAGLYPALVLSSLNAIDSVKGKLGTIKENILLRKVLVAFQFGTATIVFIGAIIIAQQIKLFFSNDLGYNKDYLVAAQVPRDWSSAGIAKMENIRRQFATMPQLSDVTLSYEIPNGNNSGNFLIFKEGGDSTTAVTSQLLMTDEHYAAAYSIPMAAGVFYGQPDAFIDSSKIVINEAQAKALGWTNVSDAIGAKVRTTGGGNPFTIAGVIKDFHFGSMQQAIQPIVFLNVNLTKTFRFFSFKVKPGNMSNTIADLQRKWTTVMPGAPFEYKFMDDTLKNLYKTELQLKQASYTATILSIIIVLLGIIGLVSLSIQKRTKEIGIRKVLGASVSGIILLFMKEFLLVIIIAGLVACPVAWFIMQGWLSDYAYRIPITITPFIIAVTGLAFITIILIMLQTLKAGIANPVKSLRTE